MSEARGPTLRVVAFNDVYALEHLPRFRSLIEHHRSTDPADVLLVTLAGDFVAPSLLSGLDAGRGMIECLNLLGVTHVCLGNHEDDIPTEALHQRVAELRATWLSTNVRAFDPKLVPHEIVAVGRVRVGLLGVVMDDPAAYRRRPFGGGEVSPPNATALAEAATLVRDKGCACVLPLTHQAVDDDRALIHAQRERLFPVVLGGHDHTVFVEQIEGTWLVKAGADAEHAVVIDLAWPAEAPADAALPELPATRVRLEHVAAYPEDAAMRALVDKHMAAVHELEGATLLTLGPGEALSSVGSRRSQTSLGTMLCSRMRDAMGAQGCLVNGGGVRASRDYHQHFTYADLKSELPFENELVVAQLPGSLVREAIAASRAHAPAESGGFLQVDDRMTVDPHTHALLALDGAPLDEARTYRIALLRDLFMGMDHVEPLLRFARENPTKIPPEGSGRELKCVLVEAFSVALWKQCGGFDAVDTNHDGSVTTDELAEAAARVTGERPSNFTAALVMHALDTDHDSVLSRAEAERAEKKAP